MSLPRCHACDREIARLTKPTAEEHCRVCAAPTCDLCAFTYGNYPELQRKICRPCAEAAGLHSAYGFDDAWAARLAFCHAEGNYALACATCGAERKLSDAVAIWKLCGRCGAPTCLACLDPFARDPLCKECQAGKLRVADLVPETGEGGAVPDVPIPVPPVAPAATAGPDPAADGRDAADAKLLAVLGRRIDRLAAPAGDGEKTKPVDFNALLTILQEGAEGFRKPPAKPVSPLDFDFGPVEREGVPAVPAVRNTPTSGALERHRRFGRNKDCPVCGTLPPPSDAGPLQMPPLFPCTLCGRTICQRCWLNRKTDTWNIFCCPTCMGDPRKVIVKGNPFRCWFEGSPPPPRGGINLCRQATEGLLGWLGL